jgi:hypothetical protein
MAGDQSEILEQELLVFDADDEYAWINPHHFYFIPSSDITAEMRFPALEVWKALLGALIIARQEEAGSWISLEPGKKNFAVLEKSKVYHSGTSEIVFWLLELLVRGVPDHDLEVKEGELKRLFKACKQADKKAAAKLEAMAWKKGDANLWRYAMAVADGKAYLARLFEGRIEL